MGHHVRVVPSRPWIEKPDGTLEPEGDHRASQVELYLAHENLRACEAALQVQRESFPEPCEPSRFTCECGREFQHVCEESEGCSWVLVKG